MSLVLDADTNDYSVTNGKFDGFKVSCYNYKIKKDLISWVTQFLIARSSFMDPKSFQMFLIEDL